MLRRQAGKLERHSCPTGVCTRTAHDSQSVGAVRG